MISLSHAGNNNDVLDLMFILTFWLCWTAQSFDLPLACHVANAACAVVVNMTTVTVSSSHLFLVVVVHALVAVEVILCFPQVPGGA